MSLQVHNSRRMKMQLMHVCVFMLILAAVQDKASIAQTTPNQQATPAQRATLDRVVAIVNNDLVLESDVEDEERAAAFQPFRDQNKMTRDQLIERLIDRDLILQQLHLQTEPPITDDQVNAELATLRKTIPACAKYHCETNEGWSKFIADQGFTEAEVQERWRVRMEVLRFIEERFRMGIRIPQSDIDDYYQKTLVPSYEKEKVKAPAEAAISDRIQEVLLQQQVTNLLGDWLKALRAQGTVRVVKPGEVMP